MHATKPLEFIARATLAAATTNDRHQKNRRLHLSPRTSHNDPPTTSKSTLSPENNFETVYFNSVDSFDNLSLKPEIKLSRIRFATQAPSMEPFKNSISPEVVGFIAMHLGQQRKQFDPEAI